MDFVELGAKVALIYMPFLFALCFHEFAHGYVAKLKGDNTAEMMGRLTLNPMSHIDWIGTVALPLVSIVTNLPIFFGWAKPVPVNERNLSRPRADMFWIALAGPLSNVLLAIIGAALFAFAYSRLGGLQVNEPIKMLLNQFILTNLFLAIFNMIPLHPLDGGKVLARFLPASINHKLEQNEQASSLILLVLFISGVMSFLVYPVMWFSNLLVNFFGIFL
jgi:Zn-dependent protease